MAPYLTRSEALLRLEAYGLDADATDVVTEPDLLAASNDLDKQGPFVGVPAAEDQERAFPRDDDTEPPDEVLFWVALRAYQLAANTAPPVISTGAGRVNVTYSRPKPSQVERRMERLLDPYLSHNASSGYTSRSYPSSVKAELWRTA